MAASWAHKSKAGVWGMNKVSAMLGKRRWGLVVRSRGQDKKADMREWFSPSRSLARSQRVIHAQQLEVLRQPYGETIAKL